MTRFRCYRNHKYFAISSLSRICVGASFLRFAFLPLFLLCNASPANRVHTPIVFDSDAAYLVLMVAFSVSTGYVGTICMMFAPKTMPEGQSQVR